MQIEENDEAFDKIDALLEADKSGGKVEDKDGDEEIVIADVGEAAAPVDEIDAGIEALKKRLADSETARIEAERRAVEAANRAKRAADETEDSNLKLIDTAIGNVKREKESLRAAYREALTVGDFDKVAELQDQMLTNAVNLNKLEEGRVNFVNRPKQTVELPNDPVERFAAQVSPASAQWVRNHPQYVTNPALQRDMFKAHEMATDVNGLQADSPAYFKFVENWLGIGKEGNGVQKAAETQEASPLSDAAVVTPKRQTPPSTAPVSRQTAGTITNPTTVTLTAEEREIAELNGMTAKEYARNKAELQKAGRIGGRNYN